MVVLASQYLLDHIIFPKLILYSNELIIHLHDGASKGFNLSGRKWWSFYPRLLIGPQANVCIPWRHATLIFTRLSGCFGNINLIFYCTTYVFMSEITSMKLYLLVFYVKKHSIIRIYFIYYRHIYDIFHIFFIREIQSDI